jgi:putative glutamine amidotransferase
MNDPHRHHVAEVTFESNVEDLGLSQPTVHASCYHHQILKDLGRGVTPIAHAAEGHVEAVRYDSAKNWAFGLQWHPEDNFDEDQAQLEIVRTFVDAARG